MLPQKRTFGSDIVDFGVPMISIPKPEYEMLLYAEQKLAALEEAGVSEWEGFAGAMRSFFIAQRGQDEADIFFGQALCRELEDVELAA